MQEKGYMFEDACLQDDKLWYFTYYYNSLNYINLKTEKSCFVGIVPHEKVAGIRLYSKIYYYKQKLILLPFEAKQIAIYDINKGIFYKNKEEFNKEKYYTAELYEGKLYMFPFVGNRVCYYDIDNDEIEEMPKITNILNALTDRNMVTVSSCFYNNKISFLLEMKNIAIEYAIDTKEIICKKIEGLSEKYFEMIQVNTGYFAFAYDKGYSIYWDEDGNKEFFYEDMFNKIQKDKFAVLWAKAGYVYAIFLETTNVFEFNIETREVKEVTFFEGRSRKDLGIVASQVKGEMILLPHYSTGKIFFEDGKSFVVKDEEIIYRKIMNSNQCLEENPCISLSKYLNFIKH